MGLSFFNQQRAREAEKAKLLEAQKVEPAKIEEVVIEPVKTVEVIEDKTPIIEPAETVEATEPKKKTDAEKLKRKK